MANTVQEENGKNLANVEPTRRGATYVPRFDIAETPEELTLYGDLPGVVREDLEIRFEGEHLIVYGKVHPRHEGREYLGGEYGVGDFHREFFVSESIDPAQISAELNNGVLTVHLPKVESLRPRRIEVRGG